MNLFHCCVLALLIGGVCVSSALAQEKPYVEFKTCYASWSDKELTVGNAFIERKWRIANGLLTATSFRDKTANVEWVVKPAAKPAPLPVATLPNESRPFQITPKTGRLSPVEDESLTLDIAAPGKASLTYRLQIFPASRGVSIRFDAQGELAESKAAKAKPSDAPSGVESPDASKKIPDAGDSLEDLLLSPQHLRFAQVTLIDQTDAHNELTFESEWLLQPNEQTLALPGNLFYIEDTLRKTGLVFLKLAPLPKARPVKSDADAFVYPGQHRLRFAGQGYPFVLLAYSGGSAGRIEALQTFQRQLRQYQPQRDAMFLTNTWGDRNRDARINEAFMLKEIAAGARLGVDVIQIDDGWQKGMSANSAHGKGAWNGFWASDPNFWQPHPQRFPSGLAPLVQAAREKGMRFGLWFAPDTTNNGANAQRDTDRLLQLHKESGIDYFKIDGIKISSSDVESNLQKFFGRLLADSNAQVTFDLDVTAETRFGYFGVTSTGPLFVENRYSDWRRYWPHHTLRNLWKLSHFVDPLRLRMEFLNNARNADKYPDDPLAPARYRPDYLFATTMYANPLGWFEISSLPEEYIASVSKLVAVWKRERAKLFAGTIVPIGSAPDGASWTGFASVAPDRQGAYILVFRELNTQADWSTDLPLLAPANYTVTPLAGDGTAELKQGKLMVHIPDAQRYLWVRLDAPPAKQ